jgi:DNA-binding MarR family transcriptional regulator
MDTDPGKPVTSAELEKLRQNWEELSSRVAEIEAAAAANDTLPTLDFSDSKLGAIASSIHDARKRRLNLFDALLFGEPAWDMLLTLFVARCRGEQLTTTRLCAATGSPRATGLRWIGLLSNQGLLQRLRAPKDARVTLIELTATGYALMRRYVIDGIAQFQMPLPD